MAIDIATPEGVDLVRRLARISDIVVENYKPGDLARRGLAYEDLAAIKPDLIWCSISGFGQTGPYSHRTGYDFLIQAMGGIMSITGGPDTAGGSPVKTGVGIADVMCGMYATVGILAALRHRDRTGQGQQIDLALYDSQIAWLINAATNHLVSGRVPGRIGNAHPNIAPYQTFEAADEHLAVAVGNDAQFARFTAVIGKPELAEDVRFRRNRDRLANLADLQAIIAGEIVKDTARNWEIRLNAEGVPAGRVASVDQALRDPHTLARGMVVSMEDQAGETPIRVLGNPLKMSATPVQYRKRPPHLDEDREAILRLIDETQDS
ncbi:CaiB/BaiF CoA transferase family protein [Ensifer sp. ENS11]|uniref:CaiB/BaiF CoA transferase family protein n=1 Tax=Ensifer sp. ENS11 TaxID=2769291 RepID=UPI000DE2EB70|nr:CoA transferase [Ensifer sp. ENS11]MBD9487244.1 CoA transferase [Ensifer sp. ENS11]